MEILQAIIGAAALWFVYFRVTTPKVKKVERVISSKYEYGFCMN